ncbi:50S ribosomal protein L10, partial [Candidatus Woesearchaeota archaeon]
MAHVSQAKKEIVKKLVDFINKYSVIGIVNMENLPTKQLQKMREQLRGKVVLIVAKRRLIKIAIDSIKDKLGIEQLKDNLVGMPGLLFTNENPFSLYKTLQKSKSSAPAKPGQKAPRSIVVQAGPTNFAPGPIIGELGSVGIKTSVEGGKLAIKEDKVVANEGDIISEKLAGILARLGIEPMEIGLDLVAAYENGTIYTKKILAIDEEEYKSNLAQAHRWAFNLAIETVIYTRDTITFMITKAFRDSKNLALEQNIIADLVAEEILTKAEVQAKMLSLETKFVTISKPQERKEIKEIKKEEITKESKE